MTKCEHCSAETPSSTLPRRYCSGTCKRAAYDARKRAAYAEAKAAGQDPSAAARERYRAQHPDYISTEERSTNRPCSVTACSDRTWAVGLCFRHYRAVARAQGKTWALQGGGRRGHQGRAKQYGVDHEPISPRAVFERDGYQCQLCGKQLTAETTWPSPDYPTLDHILPLSKGGGHLYDNVQTACYQCNVIKGARILVALAG